ncbi:hypothetical protein SK803_15755 [Lentzea sp. BCCO 10_0856]|uniref:vWA-MoxR associated protein C-terminal domain-containing protein n=1 Tax=Lentzea miocenica TaxID=3095431 RepID=A0ABU4T0I9_9PSEU|nr:hypothetical protein [Lentzea sp. BCCO 10_0856]MDX8031680.1 hypothetical protein [Lentzea sp. BCCO 10_0856]
MRRTRPCPLASGINARNHAASSSAHAPVGNVTAPCSTSTVITQFSPLRTAAAAATVCSTAISPPDRCRAADVVQRLCQTHAHGRIQHHVFDNRDVADVPVRGHQAHPGHRQYRPDIHIEMVLPSEIISLDVDQWPWETDTLIPEPIGCRYPMVVRSLDRMTKRKWHRSWHARWEELTTNLKVSRAIQRDSACWSRSACGGRLRELMSKFERKPKLVSLVLSEPPQVAKSGRDEVAVGLRAGVPLMVWHREKCDSAEFVAAVERLLHDDDDPYHLLERVRLARATAFEEGMAAEHVCGKLTVVFDDPARVVMPIPPAAPEGVSVTRYEF